MGASTSVAQEYYKVQEYWKAIDSNLAWELAIWIVEYQDMEIVDKFMEIERSALGAFKDIFFRFDSEYKGDIELFENELWKEYIQWFTVPEDKTLDILGALRQDGYLLTDYIPDESLEPTAKNLWKEFLRLKSCIKDFESINFCIYIPPTNPDGAKLTKWFSSVLQGKIPNGIRLTTIDFKESRKVKIDPSSTVVHINPQLDMISAINNELNKEGGTYNSVNPEDRFKDQVRKVLDCTTDKKKYLLLSKEVDTLLSLAKEVNTVSVDITALMIVAQAYYSIRDSKKCIDYANKAIQESEKAMQTDDASGYPIWRSSVMLKAAVLVGENDRKDAIALYELIATEAAKRVDPFYAMEGYRMAGYVYYEQNNLSIAFESTLLALVAGSHLDIQTRRQSTFIQAAALSLHLAKEIRESKDVITIEEQLTDWLGDDWRNLVESEGMKDITVRRKKSIF